MPISYLESCECIFVFFKTLTYIYIKQENMEESWNTETKTARGISNVSLKCHSLDQQTCETKH